jgi:type IVB pilus formation R64 PilN family outer membrane protein
MPNNKIARTSLLALTISLSGCAVFQQQGADQDHAISVINNSHIPSPQTVETVSAPFLLGPAVAVATQPPALLNQNITITVAQPLPVTAVAAQITQVTGIPVQVTGMNSGGGDSPSAASVGGLPAPPSALLASSGGSMPDIPDVSVHYSGSLHGLLDTIASDAGISWKFDQDSGTIVLFRVETQTFEIPALAWVTDGTNQITAQAGASSSSSSSSSGGTNATTQSTGQTTITNTQKTDVWSDLAATAKSISDGANVSTNSSSGTITVTGTPDQIAQVSQWVQTMTDNLSKQVAITIQIYSVQLNHEQNYGFTPTLAFENAAKSFGINLVGASMPVVQTSGQTPMTFGASILNTATGAAGQFAGSEVAVQALDTMGTVNQVFSRDIVTLNGQQSPIQVAQQIGYLQSSSTTSTTNAGNTTSLNPGTITAGFTGSITPRIVGGKIYLGMNMTISSLVNIKTITAGGSSIQLPTTDDTVVNQSAALQSGSTLMVTGYQENGGNSTHNGVGSPYMPLLGGGADANVTKNLIAIIVTARTL